MKEKTLEEHIKKNDAALNVKINEKEAETSAFKSSLNSQIKNVETQLKSCQDENTSLLVKV